MSLVKSSIRFKETVELVKQEARSNGVKPKLTDPRILKAMSALFSEVDKIQQDVQVRTRGRPCKYSFTRDDLITLLKREPEREPQSILRELAGDETKHTLTWASVKRKTGIGYKEAREIAINLRRYGQETEPADKELNSRELELEALMLTHPDGKQMSGSNAAAIMGVSEPTIFKWGFSKIKRRLKAGIVSPENIHVLTEG